MLSNNNRYTHKSYKDIISFVIMLLYSVILYSTFLHYKYNNIKFIQNLELVEYLKISIWVLLVMFIPLYICWLLFGKETIIIEYNNLRLEYSIMSLTYKKKKISINDITKYGIEEYYIYSIDIGGIVYDALKKECIKLVYKNKNIFIGKYYEVNIEDSTLVKIISEIKTRQTNKD